MLAEQLTTHAFLPHISDVLGLLILIVKFNFFSMVDNYDIEQLTLHNHITKADLAVITVKSKMSVAAAECHRPLKNCEER
jgi:hypothetical protein